MDNFIARQPIFNTKNEVVAYELLFRNGNLNYFVGIDGDDATRNVISNAFYSFGIKNIINEKKAFINFTENLIKEENSYNTSIRLFSNRNIRRCRTNM